MYSIYKKMSVSGGDLNIRAAIFIIFSSLYAYYIYAQNIDIFFESQFLHIPFLEDLSRNEFTLKGFFTVYSEHLFPGYNLVLAANYYLFNIWGGLDAIVHAAAVIFIAAVVLFGTKKEYFPNGTSYVAAILFLSVSLLSTTKNPQWGMALAAAIGVAISALFLARYSKLILGNTQRLSLIELALIPSAIILFLGGYSLGLIAAVGALTLFALIHRTTNIRNLIIPNIVLITSVAAYCVLVSKFSQLFGNSPTSTSFDLISCIKFLLVISSSASLGRAFFESFHILLPYYLLGGLLIYWAIIFTIKFLKGSEKNSLFFFGLLFYSLANILIVSLFRYKNGTEGGMGQWYNIHTQFLPLVIALLLLKTIKYRAFTIHEIPKAFSLLLIMACTMLGYYCDFVKVQHVKPWKQQFINQAFDLIISPEEIKDKNNSMNTMLWNYAETKAGIDFLYQSSLWIFHPRKPSFIGVSQDKWIEMDKRAMVICPYGTTKVKFNLWRNEGWPISEVLFRTNIGSTIQQIKNSEYSVDVDSKNAFVEFVPTNSSNPISSSSDPRKLIFIVNNASCEPCSCNACSSINGFTKIENWGPEESRPNENPNPQPDLGIGFWVRLSSDYKNIPIEKIEARVGNEQARNLVLDDGLLTFSVSPSLTSASGVHEVYLKNNMSQDTVYVGRFIVH